jgi:hypothetical protein
MKIGPLTAEEWAKDTFKVVLLSDNPVAVVKALVERIHIETLKQSAVTSTSALHKVQAAVDQARAERNERRKAR